MGEAVAVQPLADPRQPASGGLARPGWRDGCDAATRALAEAATRLVSAHGALSGMLGIGSRGAVFGCAHGVIAAALRESLQASVVAYVGDELQLCEAARIAWRQHPGHVDVATVHDFAVDPRRQPFDWMLLVDGDNLLRDPHAARALLYCALLNMRRGTRIFSIGLAPAPGGDFRLLGSFSRWPMLLRLAGRVAAHGRAAWRGAGNEPSLGETGLWRYAPLELEGIGCAEVAGEVARRAGALHRSHGLLDIRDYAALLEMLLGNCVHVRAAPLADLVHDEDCATVRVGLRHDVDLDLPTAVRMSAVEREAAVRSSYFLLHSSPVYFGAFGPAGRFFRFTGSRAWYREIEDNGQQIGLHMDPVGIALEHDADGVQAMHEEWQWLRSLGLTPQGACGHNSAWEYGIDNLEVMAGCNEPGHTRFEIPRSGLRRAMLGRRWIPLGGVDTQASGIGYLGDMIRVVGREPLLPPRQSDYGPLIQTRPIYECRYDRLYSLGYAGKWSVTQSQYSGKSTGLSTAEVRDGIRSMPHGARVILNIHPVYLGARNPDGGAVR